MLFGRYSKWPPLKARLFWRASKRTPQTSRCFKLKLWLKRVESVAEKIFPRRQNKFSSVGIGAREVEMKGLVD